jgi:Na+-transporting NADH:ubiquinone oxidoreductase subunit C
MSDTAGRTLTVAAVLCGVCSVLVASAVVLLRPTQNVNKEIDFKRNILMSAGLLKEGVDVQATYAQYIQPVVVDLTSGEIREDIDSSSFDQTKADSDPKYVDELDKRQDIGGIKRRSRLQTVYLVKKDGELSQIVLHVYGKGLWSTMKGFLSLAPDTTTVRGFNYYTHGETPGLGGEVDNPRWINQWPGKKVFDEEFKPVITVAKGFVDAADPRREYKVDGLSGATLTAVGVQNTFRFWLSDLGYGKFLANVRDGGI